MCENEAELVSLAEFRVSYWHGHLDALMLIKTLMDSPRQLDNPLNVTDIEKMLEAVMSHIPPRKKELST